MSPVVLVVCGGSRSMATESSLPESSRCGTDRRFQSDYAEAGCRARLRVPGLRPTLLALIDTIFMVYVLLTTSLTTQSELLGLRNTTPVAGTPARPTVNNLAIHAIRRQSKNAGGCTRHVATPCHGDDGATLCHFLRSQASLGYQTHGRLKLRRCTGSEWQRR